jgi:TolB protein
MLLLLCRQGAWPNKRPRPMPAGPGGKDVVVELLAHDSFHGPAEAGHVFEADDAH